MNQSTSLVLGHRRSSLAQAATSFLAIFIGSIAIALCAQIAFHVPFSPVPISLQTLGVLMVAATLGRNRGTAALALYVLEGVCGFPVFALGGFGPAALFGPTGGYLLGFIAAAYCVGTVFDQARNSPLARTWGRTLSALIAGQALIYVMGASWLAVFVGGEGALRAGILPFVIGDAIKIAIATAALGIFSRPAKAQV